MPRLFVAVWASPEVRERARAVQAALGAQSRELRFTEHEQLHATLVFLGTIDEGRAGEAERACAKTAQASAPFSVAIDRLGAFPSERRAGTLWLGSRREEPAFGVLTERLRGMLRDAGFALDEKAAIVHVTLARAKTPIVLPALDVAAVAWPIQRIALVESRTLPQGARYTERRSWELAGA
ncbi:MAG: RNA 2',3'-cyclic phosphodiesterase [bacterium]|nr:RNA 2',3'-cyclic phosphodiesterase [bacterium]